MRHKKRGKEIRNLIILSVVFIGAIALVLLINTIKWSPTTILPPESPEMIAKRQSPDNAYYTFEKASGLVPKKQGDLMFTGMPNMMFDLKKINEGKNASLKQKSTESSYLEQCQPAIALLRQGLTQDTFYYSEIPMLNSQPAYLDSLRSLNDMLRTCAIQAVRNKDIETSTTYLLDMLRFGIMLAQDGGFSEYAMAHEFQSCALVEIRDCAETCASPESLDAIREEIAGVSVQQRFIRQYLEYELRKLDVWIEAGLPLPPGRSPSMVERFFHLWTTKSALQFIIQNKPLFFEAADLSYREFQEQKRQLLDELSSERGPRNYALNEIESALSQQAGLVTLYRGVEIALALERYRMDHGAYPKKLGRLAPKYLDTIPNDAFYEMPFQYRWTKTSYRLYSVGGDGEDNNGAQDSRDFIIHAPPASIDDAAAKAS